MLWRRKYKPENITEKQVEDLLKCGSNYVGAKDREGNI